VDKIDGELGIQIICLTFSRFSSAPYLEAVTLVVYWSHGQ